MQVYRSARKSVRRPHRYTSVPYTSTWVYALWVCRSTFVLSTYGVKACTCMRPWSVACVCVCVCVHVCVCASMYLCIRVTVRVIPVCVIAKRYG